jgi:hypothetical protein
MDTPPPPPLHYHVPPPARLHSRAGIVSFGLFFVPFLAVIALPVVRVPSGGRPPQFVSFLLLLLVVAGSTLAGLVLGVVGVCSYSRKRGFAVAGLILNGVVVMLLAGLVVAVGLKSSM